MRATFIVVAPCPAWRAGCSKDPEFAKQEYLKSGDRYAAEKKLREAVVQYRNAIQQDPRFGEARLKLAETYEKLNDGRNAYREYIRAADLLPDNVDAQVKAATPAARHAQFEDAKTRAEKALAKDPKNVEAQVILGNALAGLNNLPEAIKELEEADSARSESAAALHLAGRGRGGQRPAACRRGGLPKGGGDEPDVADCPHGARQLPDVDRSRRRGRGLVEEGGGARPRQHPRQPRAGSLVHRHAPPRRSRAVPEGAGRCRHDAQRARQAGAGRLLRRA